MKRRLFFFFQGIHSVALSDREAIELELKNYLQALVIVGHDDPLERWRLHQANFPRVGILAKNTSAFRPDYDHNDCAQAAKTLMFSAQIVIWSSIFDGKKCFMFVQFNKSNEFKFEFNFVVHCYGEGSAVTLAVSQDFCGGFLVAIWHNKYS